MIVLVNKENKGESYMNLKEQLFMFSLLILAPILVAFIKGIFYNK